MKPEMQRTADLPVKAQTILPAVACYVEQAAIWLACVALGRAEGSA